MNVVYSYFSSQITIDTVIPFVELLFRIKKEINHIHGSNFISNIFVNLLYNLIGEGNGKNVFSSIVVVVVVVVVVVAVVVFIVVVIIIVVIQLISINNNIKYLRYLRFS
jgi:hypothetical protein